MTAELLGRLPGLGRLWEATKGRPEVVIAVLDGPVDEAALRPAGVVEHGTHVTSIISGSKDVPGIAPGCSVVAIPIFAAPAPGAQPVCTQGDLAAGIRKALAEQANIINISAAQQADLTGVSTDLSGALQEAAQRDVLVVAAAGNQGCACDTIPASVPGVLAVGAHDGAGVPLLSSNWGQQQRTQGLTAPGADVPGACVGGGVCRATGTSFAAATVSGVAGLLMSIDVERGRKPSGARTRKLLLQSCVPPARDEVEIASTHLSGRLDLTRIADILIEPAAAQPREKDVPAIPTFAREPARGQMPSGAAPAGEVETRAAGLTPADCGCGCGGGAAGACGCGGGKAQLVYAIGRLGVSFASQARRDSIWRTVNGKAEGDLKPITDKALQDLFKKQPFQAQSVIWTLSRSEVAMYAIMPDGAFASDAYKWLATEWADEDVEFVSIPGVLAGQTTLYDGQVVDVIVPDLRGMYSWETKTYVKALRDAAKKLNAAASDDMINREIGRFLGKIYFSIRNRGLSPEERALNSAATNAFNFSPVIVEAGGDGMTLRDVAVERSPLNRPGGEYFDVLLTFFDPQHRTERAPLRARFTIDVSDTVPVMIGNPVTWFEY